MNNFLLLTLIFAGFQIQDSLAFSPPEPIKDCWDGNKCIKDEHCGNRGECFGVFTILTDPPTYKPGLAFINKSISYQFITKIKFISDLANAHVYKG